MLLDLWNLLTEDEPSVGRRDGKALAGPALDRNVQVVQLRGRVVVRVRVWGAAVARPVVSGPVQVALSGAVAVSARPWVTVLSAVAAAREADDEAVLLLAL